MHQFAAPALWLTVGSETREETFGLAVGPGIYGLVLQVFGHAPSSTGAAGEQHATPAA